MAMYCSHLSIFWSIPVFKLINSNEAMPPDYHLALREEVKENLEKVKKVITDKWAIIELGDGEISGMRR